MVRKIEKGVSAPRREEEGVGSGVLKDLSSKFKSKVGALFATMAVLGGVDEAKAETGSTGNIQLIGDINDPTENGPASVNFSSLVSPTMEEGQTFGSGEVLEISPQYSLQVKFGSNGKVLDVLDNVTGNVLESITFTGNISNAVPLGNGFIVVNANNVGNDLYIFNIAEIGSVQGISPVESSYSELVALFPLYLITNPQTGDVAGVAFPGGKAFMYHLGEFTDNPDLNWQVNEAHVLNTINAQGSNVVGLYGGVDSYGDIHMALRHANNGPINYYINPASEVMAPVELPVIQAPNSLELNLNNIGGEILDVEVTNVPENGKVVMELGGVEFEFSSAGNDQYVKGFSLNELIGIEKGEFEMIGVVKVLDGNGDVVKDENDNVVSAEVAVSVDLVAPTKVGFEIEGAVDGVLEVEEVPAKVIVKLSEMPDVDATTTLSVVSIPMGPGMTMVEFENMSEEDKVLYVRSFLELQEGSNGEMEVKMGSLGSVTSVDANSDTVEVELSEGDVVMSLVSVDDAENIMITVNGYTVLLIVKTVMEPDVDMGGGMPDMDPEVDAGSDTDMDPQADAGSDTDMDVEVKPDSGVQPPTKTPGNGGGDEPMCASSGVGNGGKAPLSPLGALGITIAGAGLAFGRRRKKSDKEASNTVKVTMDFDPKKKD